MNNPTFFNLNIQKTILQYYVIRQVTDMTFFVFFLK